MGRMYELGSEGDGFYPFLTTGPVKEGALYPTNRILEAGEPLVLDMGPIHEGYNGDCMRTGFAGEPTDEFKERYRLNYESMYAGIETIKPGIHISEVDAAVRKAARADQVIVNGEEVRQDWLKGKYRWGCDARVVSGGLREGFEGDFVAEAFELGD
jgi:methionine aminopeptidase